MSWLARSMANTLLIDDDNKNNHDEAQCKGQSQEQNDVVGRENVQGEVDLDLLHRFDHNNKNNVNDNDNNNNNNYDHSVNSNDDDHDDQRHGVKEDLSEFTETVTRQLWGVASFLAPPPPAPPPQPPLRLMTAAVRMKLENELEEDETEEEEGEYEEDVENLSDYEEEDDRVEEDAVGITEEVLAFAQNIAHHPETWLDFPLLDEEDFEDFEISDAQLKHALVIERLAPRLAALRFEFCPAHMSEGYFWMVYFVLLHSRLNKHDADLLSTPQLVQARAMWMKELQKHTEPETDWFGRKTFYSQQGMHSPREDFDAHLSDDSHPRYMSETPYAAEPGPYHMTTDFNTEEHPVECAEVQFSEKSVEDLSGKIEIQKELLAGPSNEVLLHNYDDDNVGDDWLEETAKLEGFPSTGIISLENEEDVSFSDLEEDSDWTLPVKSK